MADTFNYYTDSSSFLGWALITMLGEAREAGRDAKEDFFEELKRRSDGFSKVEMSIKLNGLEVDAKQFMERIDKLIDTMVDRETSKRLQGIKEIDEIEDELTNVRDILKQRVNQLADKYDIELYRED